jgi:hypothetical protein
MLWNAYPGRNRFLGEGFLQRWYETAAQHDYSVKQL